MLGKEPLFADFEREAGAAGAAAKSLIREPRRTVDHWSVRHDVDGLQ